VGCSAGLNAPVNKAETRGETRVYRRLGAVGKKTGGRTIMRQRAAGNAPPVMLQTKIQPK